MPPEVSMCLLSYTNGDFVQVLQILGLSIQQRPKLANYIPQNQALPVINAQQYELPRYEDKQEEDRILIDHDQFISVVPGRSFCDARIAKIVCFEIVFCLYFTSKADFYDKISPILVFLAI